MYCVVASQSVWVTFFKLIISFQHNKSVQIKMKKRRKNERVWVRSPVSFPKASSSLIQLIHIYPRARASRKRGMGEQKRKKDDRSIYGKRFKYVIQTIYVILIEICSLFSSSRARSLLGPNVCRLGLTCWMTTNSARPFLHPYLSVHCVVRVSIVFRIAKM